MLLNGNIDKGDTIMSEERDIIGDATGFDCGDVFLSEQQVKDYFDAENQIMMFGEDAVVNQDKLDEWAKIILEKRWHCCF